MTAYFDSMGERLQKIQAAWTQESLAVHTMIEEFDVELCRDVSIASATPGFPSDIAEKIDRAILRYSVYSQPVNGTSPSYEEWEDHVSGMSHLVADLHTIFHELAQRDMHRFSDDPRSPLRALYSVADERRERLARVGSEVKDTEPAPAGPMSFDNYSKEINRDVARFVEYWRSNQVAEPDKFPDSMDSADWHEQFILFLSSVEH